MDLENARYIIKNELAGNEKGICDLADEIQALGFRICPRNIYQDEKSKEICISCKGNCRKRYATCFKKYFKKLKGEV